jgi:phosphatidylserine synthase
VFGWFYLIPLDYKALGKHVASSVGFLSNIIYWRESGYFDAASHEKWLLHTWSLSVEWQFYIIYPMVLIVLKRFLSLENLKRLIVIGTVLGFAFSVVATIRWPNPAYYLLPTRAWEMMMGGVAFLYPWNVTETKKKVLEIIGFLLILASYVFVKSDIPWPGHFALIPVLGSYLIIVANRQSSVITNNKVFQCLGKWSYSIYLWHWPVVVFGYYFGIQNWYLYGLILSVALGFVSFKLIENIRFRTFDNWSNVLKAKPIILALFVSFIATISIKSPLINNMPSYGNEAHLYMDRYRSESYSLARHEYEYFADECNFFDYFSNSFEVVRDVISPRCLNDRHDKTNVFIWGDSHAQAIGQAIKGDIDINVSQIASSSCKPEVGHVVNSRLRGTRKQACKISNSFAIDKIKEIKPDIVILAQKDEHNLNDFDKTAQELKSMGVKKVILIGPTPQWSDLPLVISRKYMNKDIVMLPKNGMRKAVFQTDSYMRNKGETSYKYVSLIENLCSETKCLAKVDDDNSALVFDYGHLSKEGADYIYNSFLKMEMLY